MKTYILAKGSQSLDGLKTTPPPRTPPPPPSSPHPRIRHQPQLPRLPRRQRRLLQRPNEIRLNPSLRRRGRSHLRRPECQTLQTRRQSRRHLLPNLVRRHHAIFPPRHGRLHKWHALRSRRPRRRWRCKTPRRLLFRRRRNTPLRRSHCLARPHSHAQSRQTRPNRPLPRHRRRLHLRPPIRQVRRRPRHHHFIQQRKTRPCQRPRRRRSHQLQRISRLGKEDRRTHQQARCRPHHRSRRPRHPPKILQSHRPRRPNRPHRRSRRPQRRHQPSNHDDERCQPPGHLRRHHKNVRRHDPRHHPIQNQTGDRSRLPLRPSPRRLQPPNHRPTLRQTRNHRLTTSSRIHRAAPRTPASRRSIRVGAQHAAPQARTISAYRQLLGA